MGVAPEVLQDLERDRLRLAREQGLSREVETARQRSALSRALAEEATAVTRGEAGPPRTREEFLDLYDAREGETRWQLWQAHQAKAPAYALVRGRGAEEIAAAKAGYQGDAAILERVEREDAAERARDPAGYGLTWAAGFRTAYEQAQDHAFDKGKEPSDWDFAIVSPKLYQRLLLEDPALSRTAGRTIPVNADRMQKLGFTELASWMRQIKRDASVMVYQSEAAVKGRGPSLWMDP